MARPIILANGRLMVGLDEHGLVHDFYYPYIGLDNLTTARSVSHKIGIWVDGQFSWTDDGSWEIELGLEDTALISSVFMRSSKLQLEISTVDFIDSTQDAFIRRFKVINKADTARDIRIFLHQVFQISQAGRADSALFAPEPKYLYTYHERIGLLSYCRTTSGKSFDQYAVGNYGVEGKEGTFRDAEDGELSDNNVEHGGVDSVMRLQMQLEPGGVENIEYWTIAKDSHDAQYECEQAHERLLAKGADYRENSTRQYWGKWLDTAKPELAKLPREYRLPAQKSLLIIKAHVDNRGAILASGDSSIFNYGRDYYCYCWPRDALFALWPLIRLGYKSEARKFFVFARDVLTKKGYLMHKYLPDRTVGSSWHPLVRDNHPELAIQEDESAIVLIMLLEYYARTNDVNFVASLYADLVKPIANFMASYIDERTNLPHASYDLWEEKFLTSTYTVATVERALFCAAELATLFKHPEDAEKWRKTAETMQKSVNLLVDPDTGVFRKGFLAKEDGSLEFDNTLDASSLYGMLMFSTAEGRKEAVEATEKAIATTLASNNGNAIARYKGDNYFIKDPASVGNPWFVCSLWMAQYYIHTNNAEKAHNTLDWTLNLALNTGVFSEQLDPNTGEPIGVAPLIWSHAEFINTVLDLKS